MRARPSGVCNPEGGCRARSLFLELSEFGHTFNKMTVKFEDGEGGSLEGDSACLGTSGALSGSVGGCDYEPPSLMKLDYSPQKIKLHKAAFKR